MRVGVALSIPVLLALPLAVACVEDDFADGQFKCDPSATSDDVCPPGLSCGLDGLCRHSANPSCKKRTCDEALPSCGTLDDGCGGVLDCSCWPPLSCGGGGVVGKCGCLPEQAFERTASAFWSDASIGSAAWVDLEQAADPDDAYASAMLGAAATSNYLKAADFGFDLPPTAVVRGIELVIERSASDATAVKDHQVRIAVDGNLLPKNAMVDAAWPDVDASATYGGASDLWEGTDITPEQINAPDFGMAVAVDASAEATARVDSIKIRVHVANPSCPPGAGG